MPSNQPTILVKNPTITTYFPLNTAKRCKNAVKWQCGDRKRPDKMGVWCKKII